MRPFVDRPITDIGAASDLAVQAAAHWELPQPVLLRVGMNAIYRSGDVVLRVSEPSAPASASLQLAGRLLEAGLRVTRPVRTDTFGEAGLYATAWEYIESTDEPIDWRAVGAMVRTVHCLDKDDLPSDYPLPRPADFPWWDFDALLAQIGDELDDDARRGIEQAVGRWPDWAHEAGAVVCHGDVHPGNVIMGSDGPILIDWDLMCLAPPGWDHAPLMTLAERWGGEPGGIRGVCRWIWIIAPFPAVRRSVRRTSIGRCHVDASPRRYAQRGCDARSSASTLLLARRIGSAGVASAVASG